MQEHWESDKCYANHGVTGSLCSNQIYLSEVCVCVCGGGGVWVCGGCGGVGVCVCVFYPDLPIRGVCVCVCVCVCTCVMLLDFSHTCTYACLGCAMLLCLVCLFDLACFFLPSFSSLIKTCIYMYMSTQVEFFCPVLPEREKAAKKIMKVSLLSWK